MPAFSLSPLTNVPPPEQESFPNFIQFRSDGTDLGLPDVDTVDFIGLEATRGVGENVNVVTVRGATPSVLRLASLPDPPVEGICFFDGTLFSDGWATVLVDVESSDWEWDTFGSVLTFITAGLYQVVASCYFEADLEWPAGATTYGSQIGDPDVFGSRGVHARFHDPESPTDTRLRMHWTDQHMLNVTDADTQLPIGLFAIADDTEAAVLFAGMTLVILRIGDPV